MCFICQDKLGESAYKILTDYQTATVTLLALLSSAPDDVSNYYSCIFHMNMSSHFVHQLASAFKLYFLVQFFQQLLNS